MCFSRSAPKKPPNLGQALDKCAEHLDEDDVRHACKDELSAWTRRVDLSRDELQVLVERPRLARLRKRCAGALE